MIISRRQFLKFCSVAAGALGLSASSLMKLEKAYADIANTAPNVVWIAGQACSGCITSLLNTAFYGDIAPILLDKIDLLYESTVAAAPGIYLDGAPQANSVTENFAPAVLAPGYVLCVEGAVPTNADFCHVGDLAGLGTATAERLSDQLIELATNAAAVLAIGTCSSFGGIPAARGGHGSTDTRTFLQANGVSTPVVRIPGCPPHPDWIVGTVLTYLTDPGNLVGNLNSDGAPRDYYSDYQCNAGPCTWRYNNSSTRPDYDSTWVEGDSKGLAKNKWTGTDVGCLGVLGCKGRKTKADCSARKWNSIVAETYGNEMSWCVGSRGGCHGCTNPTFPDGVGKFFTIP